MRVIPLSERTAFSRSFRVLSADHRRFMKITVDRKLWRSDRKFRAEVLWWARGMVAYQPPLPRNCYYQL